MASIRTNKSDLREALRVAESEGRFLSEYRRQGRDIYFQGYLMNQHFRIIGAHLSRAATPLLDWMERKLTSG